MGLRTPRPGGSPNVAMASGDLFPNGVDINPANADVQATVRPEGWFFRASAGYETVRVGAHRLDIGHPHGRGIDFTPLRLAEDIAHDPPGPQGPPLLVDPATAGRHVDIADIPGSEYLDDSGRLPAWAAEQNVGTYLAGGPEPASGGAALHAGSRTPRDMGDRDPGRPLTRAFYGALHNPVGVFRTEYAENPLAAVAVAGAIVGIVYMGVSNFERSYRSRRGRSVAGAVGAVPAASADAAGGTVASTAEVANETLTAAGEAVERAVSAAGDAVEAAGDAVEKTTEAAADAVASND